MSLLETNNNSNDDDDEEQKLQDIYWHRRWAHGDRKGDNLPKD